MRAADLHKRQVLHLLELVSSCSLWPGQGPMVSGARSKSRPLRRREDAQQMCWDVGRPERSTSPTAVPADAPAAEDLRAAPDSNSKGPKGKGRGKGRRGSAAAYKESRPQHAGASATPTVFNPAFFSWQSEPLHAVVRANQGAMSRNDTHAGCFRYFDMASALRMLRRSRFASAVAGCQSGG